MSKAGKRHYAVNRNTWWHWSRSKRKDWWKYCSQIPFADWRTLPQAGYR